MDVINQALAQISELFRNMSAGSRITAGLLLVVAVLSVGYLFQYQVTGGDDFLFSEPVASEDLNRMQAAFGKAQLNSHSIVGGQIKVPHSLRDKYMAALADANALPRQIGSILEKSLNAGSMIEPGKVRDERFKIGLQQELALIISSMQGIESASVLLDQQQQSDFQEPILKTATVFVRTQGSIRLDREQAKKIRYLLVGAWAGLKAEKVTVADPSGPVILDNEQSADSQYQSQTLEAEHNLREKILGALSYIRGVTVTPTVVLDTQKNQHTLAVKRDPKTVPTKVVEESTTDNRESVPPGGTPGFQSNQPQSVSGTGGNPTKPLTQNRETQKTETLSEIGTTQTISETIGLVPKRATVSIGIPVSYYESVWRERNPTKAGEEAKKPDQAALDAIRLETQSSVQKSVANLLPPVEGLADLSDLVQVMTFQDIKMPDIVQPPITQTAATWFDQNWRTLAIGGLVIVTLLMLRSMVRSIPAPEPEVASARISAGESTGAKEEPAEATAARRLRKMSSSGPSLRDELSELVKEDPDSAANILRAWIGQVT